MIDRSHYKLIKGDEVLCSSDRKVQLTVEKLVSLFAMLAAGYAAACMSCGVELISGLTGAVMPKETKKPLEEQLDDILQRAVATQSKPST